MKCCGLEPVKSTALGKEFLYCREGKQEVTDERPQGITSPSTKKVLDDQTQFQVMVGDTDRDVTCGGGDFLIASQEVADIYNLPTYCELVLIKRGDSK